MDFKDIIHLWSGPRCCSTSLMYSFAQRPDCICVDEPLYGSYLHHSGYTRPYGDELMKVQEKDGEKALSNLLSMRPSRPLLFAKHMAKHKYGLNNETLFSTGKHVLLVREPYNVISSFARVLENPTLLEMGYSSLLEIVSELRTRGKSVVLVLSDQLVSQPEATLRKLCELLEIDFAPEMLSWPSGPKECDGIWATLWYRNSHKATCFEPSVMTQRVPMPDCLKPLLSECQVRQ
jgi:hypothetical protein